MRTETRANQRLANFIDGGWHPPRSERYAPNRNPARPQEILGEFPDSNVDDAALAVAAAKRALPAWAATPAPQRGALLFRLAQLIDSESRTLGRIITLEQGKALAEAVSEATRTANEVRFMAGEASRLEGRTLPSDRAGYACFTRPEPLGVVAAIVPWNFPLVTCVRKVAPALVCGNTVVLKPASLTPWSASALIELIEQAGFPRGVVNLVFGQGRAVGQYLVDSDDVAGITFTGSSAVGIDLCQRAARRMAKVQLELGGKNPAVVWRYANLEHAADEIAKAAFICSGQRCTAVSRVIVGEEQADALAELLVARAQRIKVGDGMAADTTMGPVVSRAQLETVAGYVRQARNHGDRLLTGGRSPVGDPDHEGYFYPPTIFDRVDPNSPLAQEEIFGPVLPIIRVRSFDEAIDVANSTRYGLSACAFTSELRFAHEFVGRLQSGMVHINHGTTSDGHVPFGGVKDSGQGAYSIGPTAKDFFTNLKVAYMNLA